MKTHSVRKTKRMKNQNRQHETRKPFIIYVDTVIFYISRCRCFFLLFGPRIRFDSFTKIDTYWIVNAPSVPYSNPSLFLFIRLPSTPTNSILACFGSLALGFGYDYHYNHYFHFYYRISCIHRICFDIVSEGFC